MPSLSRRLTGWALASGGTGTLQTALLPELWLSSVVLLTLACICLVLSMALEEGE